MGRNREDELDFSDETKKFLRELFGESIGSPSADKKLDAIIEMLLPVSDLRLMNNRLEIIHELVSKGSSQEVLTAINNLDRKVNEFMATQEERLRGVKNKLDAIQSGVDKIQQQLADLKTNNPELDDEISAIEQTAAAIDTDVNPVVEPPAEPPVEG